MLTYNVKMCSLTIYNCVLLQIEGARRACALEGAAEFERVGSVRMCYLEIVIYKCVL